MTLRRALDRAAQRCLYIIAEVALAVVIGIALAWWLFEWWTS